MNTELKRDTGHARPSFFRSVTMLFSGTLLAQLVPFMLAPVIARLYNADQFATFGTLMAVFNMLNVLAAWRYDQAIVLPRDPNQAGNLVKGALVLVLCTTVLAGAFLLLFGERLEKAADLADLHLLVWPLVALTFLGGTQVVLLQWLLRQRAFLVIARQKVLQSVAISGATLLFGWVTWNNGLVWGYVVGWLLYAVATLWAVLRRYPFGKEWRSPAIKAALIAYKDWPMHNAWPALLNAVASGMAVIYMVTFYDVRVAGEHNFTRQYLLVPISMVSVALGQVLFERTASAVRMYQPIMRDIRRVTLALVSLAMVLALIISVAGPSLFALVFGEQWRYSGHLAGILVWGYAAQLVGGPLGSQLIAMGKVRAAIAFPLFYMALLAILPLFKGLPPGRFMALLSGTEVLAYSAYAAWVWYHGQRHDRSILHAT